jgi:hypothetical protein
MSTRASTLKNTTTRTLKGLLRNLLAQRSTATSMLALSKFFFLIVLAGADLCQALCWRWTL